MMPESTDRTALDSNQNIPRILLQGKLNITTSNYTDFGPSYSNATEYDGSGQIDLNELRIDANCEYDIWVKAPGDNKLYKAPIITINNSTGANDWCCYSEFHRQVSTSNLSQIVPIVYRNGTYGSSTDVFTIFYTIYSTKITDDNIL